MKAIVIGGDGFIGSRLAAMLAEHGHEVTRTSRRTDDEGAIYLDMLDPGYLPECDVAFICAAVTRFIDCEQQPESYRVNVDAPVAIADALEARRSLVVYLSSEAVEKALHTAYGLQKALTEAALAGIGNAIVARLGKTTEENVGGVCEALINLAAAGKPGRYRLCA
jgi:nucleoside-diphosphate-sugar epimerase